MRECAPSSCHQSSHLQLIVPCTLKFHCFCVCVSVCMYWCFWSASSSEDIIHKDNFLQDPFSNSMCSDSYILHSSSPGTYNVFMYCSWRNGFSDIPFPKIGTSFYRINTFELGAYFLGYKIKTSKLFEVWGSHINFLSVVRAVSVKSIVFLGYEAVQTDRYILIFQSNLQPPSSVADGGSRLHSYIHTYLPDNMTSNSRIQGTSHVSCCHFYLLCSFCFIHYWWNFFFISDYCTLSMCVHKFSTLFFLLRQMSEACDTLSQICLLNKLPTT